MPQTINIDQNRADFNKTPNPAPDSRGRNNDERILPAEYSSNGYYRRSASTYNVLLDYAAIGVEITDIKGGMLDALKRDIHNQNEKSSANFYQNIASDFRKSGESYKYIPQKTYTFAPSSRSDAMSHGSTYVMRNAQAKIWVSYTSSGSVQIQVHAWDVFNVKPQADKIDSKWYNKLANVLHPILTAGGFNSNMQTRASWSIIVP